MKSFKAFRLDTANHLLWRKGNRVPIPPKGFDVLAYLVENAGRVVTQDEMLEALWPGTYVNPEVLRKYILEIRKTLSDRPDKPEFIETLPKRGYRFVASVTDENEADSAVLSASEAIQDLSLETQEKEIRSATTALSQDNPSTTSKARSLAVILLLVVVAAATIGWSFRLSRNGTNSRSLNNNDSIAVLPFADLSPGKDQEYFSDGLSEQLIHDLSKISGLRVVGRFSAFQFKGKNEDIHEVGRKLGAANVLEGSVRRDGNRVRITAELIKTDDGFQLWSQTYDRKINDIFAVQDEIARATTEALQVKLLGSNGQPVILNLRNANPEAYQAFLQANYFLGRGTGKEDLDKALAYADQAVKLDETYAPAWALRATVRITMAQYAMADFTEAFRRARDEAERAIILDPTSAWGYLALARMQVFYDWDWGTANLCLTKAAALEPSSAEVFRIRSRLSLALGIPDEAIKFEEQAVALDPLRANSHLGMGYLLYLAGRYDEAERELQKVLELNPQAGLDHFTLAEVFMVEGKPQQSVAELEKEPNEWGRLTGQALAYYALGHEQDSDASLAALIAKHDSDAAYQIAQVYAYRHQTDKSFEWLERAYKQRDPGLPEIKSDPLLKNVRHDPRYTELLKKMRLPT